MLFFISLALMGLSFLPLIRRLSRLKSLPPHSQAPFLRAPILLASGAILLFVLLNIAVRLYTDALWFNALSLAKTFTTLMTTQLIIGCLGFLIAFGFIVLNVLFVRRLLQNHTFFKTQLGLALLAALILGILASNNWYEISLFLHQTASPQTDPLWQVPLSFYLFSLPFATKVLEWLALLLIITSLFDLVVLLIQATFAFSQFKQQPRTLADLLKSLLPHFFILGFYWAIFLASFLFLKVYHLMFSSNGLFTGVDYLAETVKVPLLKIDAWALLLLALLLLLVGLVPRLRKLFFSTSNQHRRRLFFALPLSLVGLLVLINIFLPLIVESVVLKPNEITLQRPYLEHAIKQTQEAYNLSSANVQVKEYSVHPQVSQELLSANQATLANIRLWDWRVLLENLKQNQEIRLYYAFNDVDVDRYYLNNNYHQVMLSVREIDKASLPENSQSWVSQHLKYTHGYGLALMSAHEITGNGKPQLYIKNIPPQVEGGFVISRPEIYFGELTNDHVFVKTTEEEFDYPAGDTNRLSRYQAEAGVKLDSIFKRLAYAWLYQSDELLFSSYFTSESRILDERNIIQRVKKIAPYLTLDADPYAVLTSDGRIVWIIDAYLLSNTFPYAEHYQYSLEQFQGANYIRNSVKITVDAYDGSVHFYISDESDLLVQALKSIFPDLYKPLSSLALDLRQHLRYPEALFTAQAELFQIYHMEDPAVFYQQEDVWDFPTEIAGSAYQTVEPYYVLLKLPEEKKPEFIIMLPFTPKNKNVMNAWLAGRCDFPNYGKLVLYKFPKGVEVLGPRQLDARIDQDTEISQALTLWGQRGSRVIRGNLLAIPLFNQELLTLLYVEPIFLKAEEASQPELKRIVLADQQHLVWAETFNEALELLVKGKQAPTIQDLLTAPHPASTSQAQEVLSQAQRLFKAYKQQLAQGNFSEAGKTLQELDRILASPQTEK